MTHPLTFAPQTYPGDRMVLMLGHQKIGAVFPPAVTSDKTDRHPWVWRLWGRAPVRDGRSKTELGAKNALIGMARTSLQQAGVE